MSDSASTIPGVPGSPNLGDAAIGAAVAGDASALRRAWRKVFGKDRRRQLGRLLGHYPATGVKWSRIVMEQETKRLVAELHPENLSALEISGDAWQEAGFKTYKNVHYPQFDICEHTLDERFDFIVADQVFEHLLWPYRAGRNVLKMLNSGGHFLVTTPFMVKIHNYPVDCSRWTELGLKQFLAECGFPLDTIVTGSWGSRACVIENFDCDIVARYRPGKHSLTNEPDVPYHVWAMARK